MIKNSVVALVAAAALAGVTVPAMAAQAPAPAPEPVAAEEASTASFDADYVLYQLRSNGVNATAVEEWGSYIRAYVVSEDGRQVMQFFDPDTLVQVQI
ncbi:MAG: hypothetical protein ABS76_36440 [Pelagibacterium sp. SCN 64-44]|nr:MAG: hypothetical protein ABS76_36440 [Pelagibacterium sp. SCN 64-44]